LSIFNGNVWTVIGPEAVEGFGETKAMSSILKDTNNVDHAVILMKINGQIQGIWCSESFLINGNNTVDGFFELTKGLNLSGSSAIRGNLTGTASTADRLTISRTINGVNFDGSSNITITANTTNLLTRGTYLTGSNFNGSLPTTWNVDASPNNDIGTIVARDSNGSFAANAITAANFIGTLSGNVNVTLPVSFKKFNENLPWEAYFEYSMGGGSRADGIAFYLQSNDTNVGGFGGGMGYQGIPNSIAVCFDTYNNSPEVPSDVSNNHIELNVNGSIDSIAVVTNPSCYGNQSGPLGDLDLCGSSETYGFSVLIGFTIVMLLGGIIAARRLSD
jgi:hypothetical protein